MSGSVVRTKKMWRDWALPLALVGVLSTGLPFLGGSFWNLGRWVVMSILAGRLLLGGGESIGPYFSLLAVWVVYIGWCGATAFWSEVPTFTLLKTVGLALTALSALFGGYVWVRTHKVEQALDYLWPWVILALIAGSPGGGGAPTGPVQYDLPVDTYYRGISGGPNFLGTIAALALPLLFYVIYRRRQDLWRRTTSILWLALAGALALVYLSNSRAASLIALSVFSGLLATISLRRRIKTFAVTAVCIMTAATLAPQSVNDFFKRNVLKQEIHEDYGVLESRKDVWAESMTAAQVGAWFGVGLGVSAGADPSAIVRPFEAGPNYGREKGNSQLAVIEEIGVVGVVLYCILQVMMFAPLIRALQLAEGHTKAALGLIVGAMAGMLVQSIAEAWWTSPGSTEFAYFCALGGAGLGLAQSVREGTLTSAQKTFVRRMTVLGTGRQPLVADAAAARVGEARQFEADLCNLDVVDESSAPATIDTSTLSLTGVVAKPSAHAKKANEGFDLATVDGLDAAAENRSRAEARSDFGVEQLDGLINLSVVD